MSDQSEYELSYFLDGEKYNCPFCNMHSVVYTVTDNQEIDWDNEKKVYVYYVLCGNNKCLKTSIHLSYYNWKTLNHKMYTGNERIDNPFTESPNNIMDMIEVEEDKLAGVLLYPETPLDSFFFYHHPTSFFTIDERIPAPIRKLVDEAEGCKEMSFMTGASGSLRRAIYKFLKEQKAEGEEYPDKIKWLKTKYSFVDSEYFDALLTIKKMSDQDMHEDDWKPFKPNDFNYLIASVKRILAEVYVRQEVNKKWLAKINEMKVKRTIDKPSEPVTP